jgi:hypothetical protein
LTLRRVGQGIALDALDEMPQQQAFLAADRVHPHHRVLGLVHRRGEDLAVASSFSNDTSGLRAA